MIAVAKSNRNSRRIHERAVSQCKHFSSSTHRKKTEAISRLICCIYDTGVICEGSQLFINMDQCCNVNPQCFCLDCRYAFPPGTSDDLPCIITILFLTCCYQYGCNCGFCSEIKDLKAKVSDGGAPAGSISDAQIQAPKNNSMEER